MSLYSYGIGHVNYISVEGDAAKKIRLGSYQNVPGHGNLVGTELQCDATADEGRQSTTRRICLDDNHNHQSRMRII